MTYARTGLLSLLLLGVVPARAADGPTRQQAAEALRKAVAFFHQKVAVHGGYVYRVSGDLALREGEGVAGPGTIWVQPPGTPAVGEAFLVAHEATGEAAPLDAARDAGHALALSQLHSGGWYYRAEFEPAARGEFAYRLGLDGGPLPDPTPKAAKGTPGGWDVWKRRKVKGNLSVLDDDTSQAAARFLARLDRALGFKDEKVHAAALLALGALRGAQYPNGGWSASFDRYPVTPPVAAEYPPLRANYPDDWPRAWPKDFTGCYVLNDNLAADMVKTLLVAHEVYNDPRDLAAAERAGGFLLLAQMPPPQPAWAQQYDREMRPVWSRAFEPPAVTGGESQGVLETLLRLAEVTGNPQYLAPIPEALGYLRTLKQADGRLPRFAELKTDRPIYFARNPDGPHRMIFNTEGMATHYGFIVPQRLDAIEAAYRRQLAAGSSKAPAPRPGSAAGPSAETARRALAAVEGLDGRGAWVDRGRLTAHKVEPGSGVIDSQTFARNVGALAAFLKASGGGRSPER